jgi:hypothetical protein
MFFRSLLRALLDSFPLGLHRLGDFSRGGMDPNGSASPDGGGG